MAKEKAARIGRTALIVLEWIAVVSMTLMLLAGLAAVALLWWPYPSPIKLGATTAGAAPTATAAPSHEDPTLSDSGAPSDNAGIASLFSPIAQVLRSPRCVNCHAGDRPLWKNGEEHPMNLSRTSITAGLACHACHQQSNADERLTQRGGPPGAPDWQLPPRDTPMIFQGLGQAALCRNLRAEQHNGARSHSELLSHVKHDPLVLWGFKPGGNRSKPPLTHAAFVRAFEAWVRADTPCSGDEPAAPKDQAPK